MRQAKGTGAAMKQVRIVRPPTRGCTFLVLGEQPERYSHPGGLGGVDALSIKEKRTAPG